MKPFFVGDQAQQEAEDASQYYKRQRPELGDEFVDELLGCYASVEKTSTSFGRFRDSLIQKCRLKRFPYTVYFLETEDWIWVATVAHDKQREGYWLDRSPEG